MANHDAVKPGLEVVIRLLALEVVLELDLPLLYSGKVILVVGRCRLCGHVQFQILNGGAESAAILFVADSNVFHKLLCRLDELVSVVVSSVVIDKTAELLDVAFKALCRLAGTTTTAVVLAGLVGLAGLSTPVVAVVGFGAVPGAGGIAGVTARRVSVGGWCRRIGRGGIAARGCGHGVGVS